MRSAMMLLFVHSLGWSKTCHWGERQRGNKTLRNALFFRCIRDLLRDGLSRGTGTLAISILSFGLWTLGPIPIHSASRSLVPAKSSSLFRRLIFSILFPTLLRFDGRSL